MTLKRALLLVLVLLFKLLLCALGTLFVMTLTLLFVFHFVFECGWGNQTQAKHLPFPVGTGAEPGWPCGQAVV